MDTKTASSSIFSSVWFSMAWMDILVRYRRSTFGPFWITISTAVFAVAIGTVYSGLFGQPVLEFLFFIAAGLVAWTFVSSCLVEGADALISGRDMLLNTTLKPIDLVYRVVVRNLIIMLHSVPIVAVAVVIASPATSLNLLALLAGLVLLVINATWLALVFAVLSLRFRDVYPMLTALLPFIFMVSPILWKPESLPASAGVTASLFVSFNPFYYIIESVRSPLYASGANYTALAGAAVLAAVGSLIAWQVYKRSEARLRYWL